MAGKVQHEIPQLYQRGFLIQGGSVAERVFVSRRGGNVYPQILTDRAQKAISIPRKTRAKDPWSQVCIFALSFSGSPAMPCNMLEVRMTMLEESAPPNNVTMQT
jgi:hypothetical protein